MQSESWPVQQVAGHNLQASPATHLAKLVKERFSVIREMSGLLEKLVDRLPGLRTHILRQVPGPFSPVPCF